MRREEKRREEKRREAESVIIVIELKSIKDAPNMHTHVWKQIRDREGGRVHANHFANSIKSYRTSQLQLANHKDIVSPHKGAINSLQVHTPTHSPSTVNSNPHLLSTLSNFTVKSDWFDRGKVSALRRLRCLSSRLRRSTIRLRRFRSSGRLLQTQVLICRWQAAPTGPQICRLHSHMVSHWHRFVRHWLIRSPH